MIINPKLNYNKNNGKLLFDSFVPRPLQEIEDEIGFDFDFYNLLFNSNNAFELMNEYINSNNNFDRILNFKVLKETFYLADILGIKNHPFETMTFRKGTTIDQKYRVISDFVNANHYASKNINSPLTVTMLKNIHKLLITDQKYNPGCFRSEKSFIKCNDKHYETIAPEYIESSIIDLISYIESDKKTSYIIKASLIFYQITVLQPFSKGNKRMALILSTLFMYKKNMIYNNILFPFNYFNKNNLIYKERINNVRNNGDFQGWIEFYLATYEQLANNIIKKITEVVSLDKLVDEMIESSGYSNKIKNNLYLVINYSKFNPVVDIKNVCKALDKTYPTIAHTVNILIDLKIFESINNYHRNKLFIYKKRFEIIYE